MLLGDVRLLSPTKLALAADYYGLDQRGKKGIWSMRKSVSDPRTHKERPLKRSTDTIDLRTAVARAAVFWEDHLARVQGGHRLLSLAPSRAWASLGEIHTHYLVAATCRPEIRKSNWNALRGLVARMVPETEPAAVSAELLDGKFVRQWQLRMKEKAEADFLPDDIEGCERTKRGANSAYRKARSVFSAAMLRSYADAGLRLPPTLAEFPKQGFLKAAPAPHSEQLSPEVVAKIWRLMPRLKEVRPAVWAAVLLIFRAGLRNKEAFQARWSWILVAPDGACAIDLRTRGDFTPKTRSDDLVDVSPQIVAELQSVRREVDKDKPEAHLVPADNDEGRREACYRSIGKFLRACGVEVHKGKLAYRLRGHAITEIWLEHGPRAAQAFARHTTLKTTEIYRGTRVTYTPLAMPSQLRAQETP